MHSRARLLILLGASQADHDTLFKRALILAETFDRFPRLKVIVGHMGEDLPFSLLRAQDGLPSPVIGLERSVLEYVQDHFLITTSRYFSAPPLRCAIDVLGADRIIYSVDYPYRSNLAGAMLLRSTGISSHDLKKIASANAEAALRLRS